MKKLRARGIEGITEALRDDCVHLMRLSRDDEVLQEAYRSTLGPLEAAEARAAEILESKGETE